MSAEKLKNLAKIPGMSDLIGSLGVQVLNDIASEYKGMYDALIEISELIDKWTAEDCDNALIVCRKALAKAKGE